MTVKWTEFPAGPQLLEGLNVGSIDFGTVGEARRSSRRRRRAGVRGQRASRARQRGHPGAQGFAAARVADLKGRKVALNKGSNVHYLLVKQLERAGVAYRDVNVVYLTPSDARAAFERGAIDAWVIWDPFQAAGRETAGRARAGRRRRRGQELPVLPGRQRLREAHPQIIQTVLDEVRKGDLWARDHRAESVALLQPVLGLDREIVELAASRLAYGVQPITREVLLEQQVADAFHALKLIPKPLNVFDAAPSILK